MAHDPDSRSLERYYIDLRSAIDVSAIGLNEDQTQRREEMEDDSHALAIGKLTPEMMLSTRGSALNALTRQLIA